MRRDIIVYFGIIQFENNNAMCQHVKGIENLIEAIGYKSVVIGVNSHIKRGEYKKISENIYAINYPDTIKDQIFECISSSDIKAILAEIGLDRIKAFIMADYRYIPMSIMKQYCESNGINYVVDVMDWFTAGKSISSVIKKIDCDLRMYFLYPKVDRRLHICSHYNKILGTGAHIAVVPGVTENINTYTNNHSYLDDKIRLVFLGQPGKRCEKEKIDWIIKGIGELNLSDKFQLSLAGFEKREFLNDNRDLLKYIHPNIIFLGRLTHSECINVLEKSDFSLIIRPNTRLSKYGLSTKIGEAFSCAIPVIATDTSDNHKYIQDGENGFICSCKYEDVKKMLQHISKLSREEIELMKNNCRAANPLHFSNYVQLFKCVVL